MRLNVPLEQPRPVSSLKPHIVKRHPLNRARASILPWLGIIDVELIE